MSNLETLTEQERPWSSKSADVRLWVTRGDGQKSTVFLTAVNSAPEEENEDSVPEPEQNKTEEEEETVHKSEVLSLKIFEDTPKWRRKKLPWSNTEVHSDEYDTDLEEDFPPSKCLICMITLYDAHVFIVILIYTMGIYINPHAIRKTLEEQLLIFKIAQEWNKLPNGIKDDLKTIFHTVNSDII